MICKLAGTEVDPSVAPQIAFISTLIESPLNGFKFVYDEII